MNKQQNTIVKNPLFTKFSALLKKKMNFEDNMNAKKVDDTIFLSVTIDIFSPTLVYFVNYARTENLLVGSTSEKRFTMFITEYIDTGLIWTWILKTFPVLVDDAIKVLKSRISEIETINKNWNADKKLLAKNMNISEIATIKNIQFTGDIHFNKAVAIVELSSNEKLLYKPKALNNEVFVNNFINELNTQSNDKNYNKTLLISNKKHYGWVQYIEHKPISTINEASDYYYRLGSLLAIAYILDLSDMHFENLISNGAYPIFVDEEVLFANNLVTPKFKLDSQRIINEQLIDSIISTGLLPIKDKNSLFDGDTSGFMGGSFQVTKRELVNTNRDDIKFIKKIVRTRKTDHLPNYLGHPILPVKYISNIKNGFKSVYQKIELNKNYFTSYILSNADKTVSRVLIRNTMEYSTLLSAEKSPGYIQNRSKLLDKLKHFSGIRELPFVNSEIKQLENLSIPYFQQKFNSKKINDVEGYSIYESKFTPKNIFIKKINRLSEKDMNKQISMIDFTLQSMKLLRTNTENSFSDFNISSQDTNNVINQAINNITELLKYHAVFGKDDSIGWVNLTVGDFDEIEFQAMSGELYNGISGVAIPLLKLYEQEHDGSIKQMLTCINNVIDILIHYNISNEIADISLPNEKLGMLLVQRKICTALNLNDFLNGNVKSIKKLLKQVIDSKLPYDDVLAGYAGLVVGIYQNFDNASSLFNDEITKITGKIIGNMKKNNFEEIYWIPRDGSKLSYASYAHGNSGIMTALLIGYEITKDEKYLQIFFKAWNFEKRLILKTGWSDLRKSDKSPSPYWCHGSSGILIARTQWVAINQKCSIFNKHQLDQIYEEMNLAINNIINTGLSISNFSLCHGISGCLMALHIYIKEFPDKQLEELIKVKAQAICEYGLKYTWLCGFGDKYYSYGLMTGISGILDALLTIKYNTDTVLNLKI